MIVIAERINATRSRIARALEERDADLLAREAQRQATAGADFIDVNAGSDPARELENLKWAVGVVQDSTDLPLCLDSPNPEVLRAGLELIAGDVVMLNSATAESGKMDAVIAIAAESGAHLVALTMDDQGVPQTADQRVSIAARLIEASEGAGIDRDQVYVDCCIQPISTSAEQGMEVISTVFRIMQGFPGVHTTCGLSNISFGLPNRGLVNRTFLACLIAAGLDSAIMDPTAGGMMDTVRAAEALAGRDEFCMDYIRAMREQQG
ncbi:MAG: dihydropteroate synthase [Planctomycetota bacterium]|jgi:5-methyltetrahydrofolate--homocysteine methyltransferase